MLDGDALELLPVAALVLAALAGVALAADAVHGHGQGGVRLGADRAQRHGAGGEALDDFGGGLDLVHRDGLGRIDLELEQAAQRHVAAALVVDDLGVLLVRPPTVGARAVLQLGDGVGAPHVLLAARAPGVFAAGVQHASQHRVGAEGGAVAGQGFLGDLEHADALDPAGGAGEILGDGVGVDADGLEQLRAAVAHVGAHAHLGHDLGQALADGLDVVVDGLLGRQLARQVLVHGGQGLHGQPGVHGLGAVAGQHGEVVHLARAAGLHHQAGAGAQALADQVLVHGRQRQQRRDRHAVGARAPVADDEDVVPAADGVHRLRAQAGQARLHALGAPGQRVGDVQHRAAELALRVALDVAQLGHVGRVQHRLAHLQPHRRVDLVDVQQVRLGANEADQAHHDGLANRVDRRVGDLREQLLEVAVQGLVLVRQHGQRAVVAHGADALLAVGGHGAHQELDVLLRVAEGLLQIEQRGRGALDPGGLRLGLADGQLGRVGAGDGLHDVVEADAQVLDPALVGLGVGQAGLDLLVVDHAALVEVDQEHLARLQAPLLDDLVLGHGQHAGLGSHDDVAALGHAVAGRTQAVAVQRGADLAAVGEDDGGRAVPGLHHGSVVLVERAAALVHGGVLLPRLGDHHHHRLGQRVAGHGQQFQAVVEGGGVGLVGEADGVELLQVGLQHGRAHHALARAHPVVVALDGVDLAVVRHVAVRVRQRPLGEGVGREALVHQAQRGDAALVLQIMEVGAHLVGQQQALVDHRAGAHAGDVILLAVLELERLDVGAGRLADDVELALQRVLHDHVGAAADEHLADHRLGGAHGGRHGHVAVDRHVAPAQQHLALGGDGALHLLLASLAAGVLLGQEDHAHAVLARRRQLDPPPGHLFAVQRVGQLNQDAGAIAHQLVGAHRAAVVQVLQDLQRMGDDAVALLAPDVRHEAHAAGVVLVGRVVQAGVLQVLSLGGRAHRVFHSWGREKEA